MNESVDSDSEGSFIMTFYRSGGINDKVSKSSKSDDSDSGVIDVNDIPELFIHEDSELFKKCSSEESDSQTENYERNEELEEHPNLEPVEVNKNIFSSDLHDHFVDPLASVPARNAWDGVHHFKVRIDYSDSIKKSDGAIYCESKNKLYVSKDYAFKVLVSAVNVPPTSVIKVTAAFSMAEHSYEVVQRCPTHAQLDYVKGNAAYEHLVQSLSEAAYYEKNSNGKLSVSIPYEKPQIGEMYTTYLFKLTCFSSCTGGINRKPFMLIFTLENNGIPLGNQTMEARVCSSPARDLRVDMNREMKVKQVHKNDDLCKSDPLQTSRKYIISVQEPELYHFLKQMQAFYESSAYAKKLTNIDL